MFRTSQVVYLVAVFFLMRHFKLFNLVEKNIKLKDKSYLLGFKFAALFVNVKNLLLLKTMSSFVPSSKASMK